MDEFAAIVLAGGDARRLGGVDKLALAVDGVSLLQRTLSAVEGADPKVVVGPRRPGVTGVRWTREDPAGQGPLAGLDAGLARTGDAPEFVAVLAADHPYLRGETVARLLGIVAASPSLPGAVLVDADGNPQWLVGVWRVAELRAAMPADPGNGSLRRVLEPLGPRRVPASGEEASDVDTPEDWQRLGDPE
jgi:molybdopterin-guanine dinucleotide biosynthesis protein A